LHIGLAAVPGSLESTGGEESGGRTGSLWHIHFRRRQNPTRASAGKVTISWLLGTLAARPPFA
jgi:hypothetical protein